MHPARRGFIDWTNSRRFVLWFLGVWILVCVLGVFITHSDAAALRDHGVHARAVVTAVHGGRDDYVTLQFMTRGGRPISADVGNYRWSPTPSVGDEPQIIYDPNDPSGNVADARQGPDFFVSWLLTGGGVIGLGLFVQTFRGRIDWRGIARRRHGY